MKGEMDGHVARMGIEERIYRILVEQHDTKRPSERLTVVVVVSSDLNVF
jgi:hypothetical protein